MDHEPAAPLDEVIRQRTMRNFPLPREERVAYRAKFFRRRETIDKPVAPP